MTSRAEQITAAVLAALATPTIAGVSAIDRDMHTVLNAGRFPAIVVETGNEEPPVRGVIGHKMRVVEVTVSVIAAGASPYTVADPFVLAAFDRLAADPSLGGLAFEFDEGETRRGRLDADRPIGVVSKSYLYKFRTTESSLEI